jgi:hypothetical protein
MKKLALLIVAVLGVSFLTGCVMTGGPVYAPLMLDMKGPMEVGDGSAGCSKVGVAEASGIILFASGDASIKAAMENGGITKVHHVDYEVMNILGWYATWKTVVYGE